MGTDLLDLKILLLWNIKVLQPKELEAIGPDSWNICIKKKVCMQKLLFC